MNKQTALRPSESLLERAAGMYDFGADLRRAPSFPDEGAAAPAETVETTKLPTLGPDRALARVGDRSEFRHVSPQRVAIDRERLRAGGFIVPEAPVGSLAEEFRIIKRRLLLGIDGSTGIPAAKRQSILVCSAQPNEGKTFCAINLALSLAGEKGIEVLLVDGDFPKPEILSVLGVEEAPGLIDAIEDPAADPESYVIGTDVRGLALLPSGRRADHVPELVASDRMASVLAELTGRRPHRVVIFDSPPALMASPASVLATHVGQVIMVVRADQTTEADVREAVSLLSGCTNISLMLNGTAFAATSRRFGSYYGYGPHETA